MDRLISAILALLVCLAAHAVAADLGPAVGPDKKLIAFAASSHAASPAYLRQHVADMERRLPLDGLIICVYLDAWVVSDHSPSGWYLGGQGPAVAKDDKHVKSGAYAAALSTVPGRGHVFLDQRVAAGPYEDRTMTLGAWVKDEHGIGHVQILDFVGDNHESSAVASEWTDDTGWRFLTATKAIRRGASVIVLRLGAGGVKGLSVSFDGCRAVVVE